MTLEDTITMNPIEASMLDINSSTAVNFDSMLQLDKNGKNKKAPRRILHFSDGTLEEYSTDEEEDDETDTKSKQVVDPRTLSWGSWMYYQAASTGSSALAACDYLGENIAYYLGITSPKFHYEIEEHERALQEEEEERRKVAEEMVGWSTNGKEKEASANCPPQPLHPLAQAYLLSTSEVSLNSTKQPQGDGHGIQASPNGGFSSLPTSMGVEDGEDSNKSPQRF